jgi:putative serine protease PepD
MKKIVSTMVAGFVGAALLLAVAFATGIVGGSSTTTKVVQGEPASYTVSNGIDAQQIYQDNINGVVEIVSTFPGATDMWGQSTGEQQGIGTGFVVSEDGYILTNAHVVSESGMTASAVTVVFKGEGESEGTQVPATIVGSDESTDVALLKIDPSQAPAFTVVRLGDSSTVSVGEQVVAIGNPLGLDFSLSSGVVSATDRELESPNGATITGGIQTDAAINSGNSGGPLFNASGEVIGINEQIATQSGGNEGIGFAVPINTAVQVMQAMQNGEYAPQAQEQTQDGYGYPQDGSQGYGYPEQGSEGYGYPQDGSGSGDYYYPY